MDYIEQLRKDKDINVTEFTNRIGVSRVVYYKWLDGTRKPKLDKIKKMCDVLDIEFANIVEKFI